MAHPVDTTRPQTAGTTAATPASDQNNHMLKNALTVAAVAAVALVVVAAAFFIEPTLMVICVIGIGIPLAISFLSCVWIPTPHDIMYAAPVSTRIVTSPIFVPRSPPIVHYRSAMPRAVAMPTSMFASATHGSRYPTSFGRSFPSTSSGWGSPLGDGAHVRVGGGHVGVGGRR